MEKASFSIWAAYREGWQRGKPQMGNLLLAAAAYLGVFVGFIVLQSAAQKAMPLLGLVLQGVQMVLVGPLMYLGFCRLSLRAHDGQRTEVAQLFGESQHLPAYWVVMLIYVAVMIALAVALVGGVLATGAGVAFKGFFQSLNGNQGSPLLDFGLPMLGVFGILFTALCLAVYVGMRVQLFPYFIVDQGLTGVASIKASWNASKGNALRLFLFLLSQGILALFAIIPLGLGLIVLVPTLLAGWGYVYRQLSGTSAAPVSVNPGPIIDGME
jgi:uncharacterized membrane protein